MNGSSAKECVGAYGICEGSSHCDPDDRGSIVIDAVIAIRAKSSLFLVNSSNEGIAPRSWVFVLTSR